MGKKAILFIVYFINFNFLPSCFFQCATHGSLGKAKINGSEKYMHIMGQIY